MPELKCNDCDQFIYSSTKVFKNSFFYLFIEIFSDKILIGDTFYIYSCPSCSTSEAFERLPMSWYTHMNSEHFVFNNLFISRFCHVIRSNLIQLVLYHLWMKGDKKHRYFRWKEDICALIEDKWDDLIPAKTSNLKG